MLLSGSRVSSALGEVLKPLGWWLSSPHLAVYTVNWLKREMDRERRMERERKESREREKERGRDEGGRKKERGTSEGEGERREREGEDEERERRERSGPCWTRDILAGLSSHSCHPGLNLVWLHMLGLGLLSRVTSRGMDRQRMR